MIIAVASGKGGTGKTSVATSLALYLTGRNIPTIFLDCDVEEPNSSLILKPHIERVEKVGIPVPVIDFGKCTYCGRCAEVCAYNAIAVTKDNVLVFPELCHGCGGCSLLCPEGAISEKEREIGVIERGIADKIKFVQGRLNIGEPLSVPIIREVKAKGLEFDRQINKGFVIIDSPPGASCPVIESVKGSDFVILVTEPTPFGLHDLKIAVETVEKLSIPFGVVINKDCTGDDSVNSYCAERKIEVLMRIPFRREIAELYSKGITMIEAEVRVEGMFEDLLSRIKVLAPSGPVKKILSF